MFDPKNPPVRRKTYEIRVGEEVHQHVVKEVQVGVIDEVLEQISRIFEFDLGGDLGEQIRTSYKNYPKEFVEALSKLTEYEEEDIRKWGIALIEEVALDWINGNYLFIKEVWAKKKGVLGAMESPKETPENQVKQPKAEPLLTESETPSGS